MTLYSNSHGKRVVGRSFLVVASLPMGECGNPLASPLAMTMKTYRLKAVGSLMIRLCVGPLRDMEPQERSTVRSGAAETAYDGHGIRCQHIERHSHMVRTHSALCHAPCAPIASSLCYGTVQD